MHSAIDLECHEVMEPAVRLKVKSSSDVLKPSTSPVSSTSSSSWLLSYDSQGNPDPQELASRSSVDVVLNEFTQRNRKPNANPSPMPKDQEDPNITSSVLTGQREVLSLISESAVNLNCQIPLWDHTLIFLSASKVYLRGILP